MENLIDQYFYKWNQHDHIEVGKMFQDNSELIDWEISVFGVEDITNATKDIFDNCPDIAIKIVNKIIDNTNNSACYEIEVHLNDENNAILNVVDVIKFNNNKICSLTAYKR